MTNRITVVAAVVLGLAGSLYGQKAAGGGPGVRMWGPPALGAPGAAVHAVARMSIDHAFAMQGLDAAGVAVRCDRSALAEAASHPGVFIIRGFPLDGAGGVDLEVERFWVTQPTTRFVVGTGTGPDRTLAFDADSVLLLRGRVADRPQSHVYLAIADSMTNGVIDLGPGLGAYGVSSRATLPGSVTVFQGQGPRGRGAIPFCATQSVKRVDPPGGVDTERRRGLRQVEVASETDYEFFQLFGDATATTTYLIQLYGAVSDIYMREINVRIDLTYTRVWPQPNEPFQASLGEFLSYWNANMGAVPRDTAQMFSGRGDLPGGVAYVGALCGGNGYSFCGNALGYFADPRYPSVVNYDPMVTAHELGHNCGTLHTHDYALDNCDQVATIPQRGTIMSYCNQTVSGAQSVIDMGFHTRTRTAMTDYLPTATCTVLDCNQNGRSDALDIALASSPDVNANGIPDECEDCNHNGRLDNIDISLGSSFDLNTNGVPDECEPDCNGNLIPDDRDILLGTSADLHFDGVPDECDADLNGNGVSDYNEIWSNMTLDKDRNRKLDSKQDCDGDGIPDMVELEGAGDAWSASLAAENAIREYHPVTAVLMNQSAGGTVAAGQDLVITATRRILVTSATTNNVVEFSRTGALVGTFIAAGSGGLANPAQMLLTPAGTLLVASRGNNSVLEYNLTTGAFLRAFVTAGSGGLASPFGLTLAPNGNLCVSSSTSNQVFEYNGTTGAFVRIMVTTAGNGGLSGARGLLFNPFDGTLLVAGFGNDQIKQYNGTTGAFIRDWLITGLPIDGPWCLRLGRDGMIYISRNNDAADTHFTRARIFIHDPRNGNFVRAYVQSLDAGLSRPTGFAFMPGAPTDCNGNVLPDNCDIAGGFSSDINNNGIPDECERTCYANCDLSAVAPVLNVNDFACFLNQYAAGLSYANCDGSTTAPVLNVLDFGCFLNRFAAGCP